MSIEVAGSLTVGTVDTPLDLRTRVNTLSDVLQIENPFVGMKFYCLETGKSYTVKSLKEKLIGSFTVQDALINEYEADPDLSDVSDKIDKNQIGKSGGVVGLDSKGKIPEVYLPAISGGAASPATITLPIPSDQNHDNLTLLLDISEDGTFIEENSELETSANYTRIRMIDHWHKMRVFNGTDWEKLETSSLGVPYYEGTIEFTLDDEMFPGYVSGKKYYARYTWLDSHGGYDNWIGFSFTGDVADMRPIRTNIVDNMKMIDKGDIDGDIVLDWNEGEIQHYTLLDNATINQNNIVNIPFGEALIAYVNVGDSVLTVKGQDEFICNGTEKTYCVSAVNFGKLMVCVTEIL